MSSVASIPNFLLYQPWAFEGRRVVGTTSRAAVVPGAYGLQAGDANDTTCFDDHPSFHEASLEGRPPGGNATIWGRNRVSQMVRFACRRDGQRVEVPWRLRPEANNCSTVRPVRRMPVPAGLETSGTCLLVRMPPSSMALLAASAESKVDS